MTWGRLPLSLPPAYEQCQLYKQQARAQKLELRTTRARCESHLPDSQRPRKGPHQWKQHSQAGAFYVIIALTLHKLGAQCLCQEIQRLLKQELGEILVLYGLVAGVGVCMKGLWEVGFMHLSV